MLLKLVKRLIHVLFAHARSAISPSIHNGSKIVNSMTRICLEGSYTPSATYLPCTCTTYPTLLPYPTTHTFTHTASFPTLPHAFFLPTF